MGLYYHQIIQAPEDPTQWQLYLDNMEKDATAGRRLLLTLPAGSWGPVQLYTRMYVDIRGASTDRSVTEVWNDVSVSDPLVGDVIWQTGSDTIIGHLTVRHTPVLSGTVKYAQHFDAWGLGSIQAVHVNVAFESYPKHAVGIGMHLAQDVFYFDCLFRRTNAGASAGGTINWHNFNGPLASPTDTLFDGCDLENLAPGDGLQVTSFATGVADRLMWRGAANSLRAGSGGSDFYREGTSDVLAYATPGSYATTSGGTPLDITGLVLPVPARMPTRY